MSDELHKAWIHGCELLTDNEELANRLCEGHGLNNTLEMYLETEQPGLVGALVVARQELERQDLPVEAFCFIDGKVQARTSGILGYRATNWHELGSSLPERVVKCTNDRKREIYTLETITEAIAAACHQQNRVWCLAHHDESQSMWENEPDWQRNSVIAGVRGALAGNTPEESHEGWLKLKREEGWSLGPEKNTAVKTHPCMLPYNDLPEEQKIKDTYFITMVQQLGKVLGLL